MIQTGKKLQPKRTVSPKQVKITDPFWSKYADLVRNVVIPYQYEALHDRIPDAEPSHAISNFEIAAGRKEGDFGGFVFQDSDLAKFLEAVGNLLMTHPDPELERLADEVIDLVAEAQWEDGYLNTYFTIKEPDKRWTNLTDCHELYCAGHMIEAAVAYYEATGKRKLLDVVCRFADYIDTVFGPEEGKLHGYDGHEEIELALVKLHRVTGDGKYLRLSKFFIEERGKQPNFLKEDWEKRGKINFYTGSVSPLDLKYFQAHLPVRDQTEAVGHAVRAVYMYSAMADLAAYGDDSLFDACKRLWNNMTKKQMYVTGGIGSTHHGEAFSTDYDLPNDTVYSETCASIGLVFFARRMLRLQAKSEYGDVMERALYNAVIAGMSQDGKHYFYVNPLEVWPKASLHNPGKHHVKPERQKWFGCACCPPNLARLITSLGSYIYDCTEDTIYTHLYIGGEALLYVGDRKVTIHQQTNYPWEGDVSLAMLLEQDASFTLALRLPGWSNQTAVYVNGEPINVDDNRRDGYLYVQRLWKDGDTVELKFSMDVKLLQANPEVRTDAGKTVIQRGPLVYCLEEADNGAPISCLALDLNSPFSAVFEPDVLGGCTVIEGKAFREGDGDWTDTLYKPLSKEAGRHTSFKAIPYFLWGNRGIGDMAVWNRYR
jgi:uncharacterized protein